jgi:uncharacterized protein (DUF2237 family)
MRPRVRGTSPGEPMKTEARNVLGRPLAACSMSPKTGWFRDGCCNTDDNDRGAHVVCVRVTAEFLAFSKRVGNDLSTPAPAYGFPGLKPGDRWCVCAARWVEAWRAGCAPLVVLESTHEGMLAYAPIEALRAHAAEVN